MAVYFDAPDPVLFTQKCLEKNKQFFRLHKFRSMKMSTPHDKPTHMLENPEQYITKSGKFIRAHSLDELPQIWDIFIGNMSVIGPRSALWNQDWLTACRDEYGANDIKPGLTGWAQINGRDELEIPVKAEYDGVYAKKIGIGMDVKCFLGSLGVFKGDASVVEGGTGEMKETGEEEMKKVLITGAGSYIGEKTREYLEQWPDKYSAKMIDTMGWKPSVYDFKNVDVAFNVAGIAHIKETKENEHLYYEINRDLSVAIAKTAKSAGVKQYILLSTMSAYGLVTGRISKDTPVNPVNAYGKSKAEADEEIRKMVDDNFIFTCLRPPMVYGKDCKGNYQQLRNFALKSPIFPQIDNKRSMIYIGNLCEFVKQCIDFERSGLFFPQNAEYVNTSEMVKLIAESNGKTIRLTKAFNWCLKLANVNVVKKVFGDLTYEPVDTVGNYSFEASIKLTEET